MRLTSSNTSSCVTTSASAPPRTRGSFSLNNPESYRASTDDRASVPVSSDSRAPASRTPRTLFTASIKTRRVSSRPVGNNCMGSGSPWDWTLIVNFRPYFLDECVHRVQ